jgi:hypothetical protein
MVLSILHLDEQGVNGHITRAEEIIGIIDTYEHGQEAKEYATIV